MGDPVSWMVIEPGWTVVDADGETVGRIDEVVGDEKVDIFNGLKVLTGLLGAPRYVPAEQVGEIVEGRVSLRLTKEQLEELEHHGEPPPSEAFRP